MIRKTMTVLAMGLSLAAASAPAFAQSAAAKATVDAAKVSGTVGEQADGYLAIVAGGDAGLRAAVAEINTGRAVAYKDIAAKTGVTQTPPAKPPPSNSTPAWPPASSGSRWMAAG
jgi:uncharacterized protein YdbL (DUF1318 family)